tara:strand:+ start:1592 stop:2122 length:531 start_codon:yes stop_codon:yes gene_type:complete
VHLLKQKAAIMNLVINNTQITTDESGRFSLNDLHKASGGQDKYRPSYFYRCDSFKKFLMALTVQNHTVEPIIKKQGRHNGGTWVCKELVYKYAMWINADFELKVIQTFDQMMGLIDAPLTMKALNDLTAKIERDQGIASDCGKALNHYKKVKKQNEERFIEGVKTLQLNLGFEVSK